MLTAFFVHRPRRGGETLPYWVVSTGTKLVQNFHTNGAAIRWIEQETKKENVHIECECAWSPCKKMVHVLLAKRLGDSFFCSFDCGWYNNEPVH